MEFVDALTTIDSHLGMVGFVERGKCFHLLKFSGDLHTTDPFRWTCGEARISFDTMEKGSPRSSMRHVERRGEA